VRDLSAGAVDAAVVVAADSLLDGPRLQVLHAQGRLKCDGAPAGLQPGEAGVALLLMRAADPALPPGPRLSLLTLCMDDEPLAFSAGSASTGEALARVLAAAGAHRPGGPAWVLSDHNGEHYRANDWGSAWARLRAQDEAFADCTVWYPALSFGDTGAAGSLLALAMVQQAHLRGYAPAPTALVSAAADGPERGAVLLQLH
jgi:3-oxoacyl-[acyl-carrier-protein] synthase-1